MPHRKKRILISVPAQDREEILKNLADQGQTEIKTVENDADAILAEIGKAISADHPYDLLIISISIKHHNGKELLKNLRHRHRLQIPFILVCHHEPDMVENLTLINFGSAACLVPPYGAEKLGALIKHLHA